MEKIWLKSYPAGVPAEIDINQYASLREVLEEACAKYGSRPAYSCMGAQIAAHLANAGVPVIVFDLAAKDGDPNSIVRNAVDKLKKLEPPPLAAKDRAACIDAANYDQNLGQLAECDLVIEAISERMKSFKEVKEKDVITLDFVDGSTRIGLNGEAKGTIGGDAFNQTLTRVWLGEKPVQADLKKSLLGA